MFDKLAEDIEKRYWQKLAALEKEAMRREMKAWRKLLPVSKNKVLDALKPGEVRQLPGKPIGHGGEGEAFAGISRENGPINQDNDYFNTVIKKVYNIGDEIKNPSRQTIAKADVFDNPELKDIFANNRFINPGVSISKYLPYSNPSNSPKYDDLYKSRKGKKFLIDLNRKATDEFKQKLHNVSLNTKTVDDISINPTGLVVTGKTGKKYFVSDFPVQTNPDTNVGFDTDSNSFRIYDPRVEDYDYLQNLPYLPDIIREALQLVK